MTTPQDIITQALKKAGVLGVGQSALAEDTNDAYADLQDMLGQWQRKRWLIWHLVEYYVTSTGALYYTVGPGGDFNINPRPDKVEAAFFRQLIQSQPNQIDYMLQRIDAYETYAQISLKQLQTFPQDYFYDSGFPLAKLYVWPVPLASIYQIHIVVKETLSQFTSLNQTISMPLEYMAALKYNLAIRLRQSYQLPVDQALVALAEDALNIIRNANTQIPRLRLPTALVRPTLYNIYSDTTY
jgi:hypothetical protein